MKILRIEGENLASLCGRFAVDFTKPPLSSTGVFAICGPTGSGKSSLLDAMCLALYGRTPRVGGKKIEALMLGEFSVADARSLLSRGKNHGFAAVEFESSLGRFRAEWRVDKPKKKLKDKTTKDADRELYQFDANGERTLVDMRHREIDEFIGLKFDQFTKTVLLAQGEFRRFLDSSANDRSELLEKLTNTGVFTAIGRAAFQRAKQERERLNVLVALSQGIILLDDEARSQLRIRHAGLVVQLAMLQKNLETARVAQEWHTLTGSLRNAVAVAQTELEKAESERVALGTLRHDLADFDRCLTLREQCTSWENLNKKIAETKQQSERHAEDLARAQASLSELDRQAVPLREQREAFNLQKSRLEQELALVEPLDRDLERVARERKNFDVQRNSLSGGLRDCLAELRKARAQRAAWLLQQKAVRERLAAQPSTAHDDLARVRRAQEQLSTTIESLKIYLHHRSLLRDPLQQQARFAAERAALVRGTPCPLCGGLEHPATLHDPGSEIQLLQRRLADGQRQIQTLESTIAQAQKDSETVRALDGKLEAQAFTDLLQVKELQRLWMERQKNASNLRRACDELAKKRTERVKLLDGLDATIVRRQLAAQEKALKERETAHARDEADARRREAESSALRISCVESLTKLQDAHGDTKRAIDETLLTLGILRDRARAVIGFSPKDVEHWRERVRVCDSTLHSAQGSLASTRAQLQKHAESRPGLDAEESQRLLEETKNELQSVGKDERDVLLQLERDADARAKHGDLDAQIAAQATIAERWERLESLIGGAKGDSFRRFAQNITLGRLCARANRHLARLHRRYELRPWSNMEIVVADNDMGGEIRSSRSLSGGEGFLVSMALALGLSDMVSKKTEIGSLFIDEGFGTLDADTMQTVVSVLEELRLQGRTVGVVSHVDGLAKQLGASIQITPLGDGRSTLKVCGNRSEP